MTYTAPWQRLCDCRCPLHYRQTRITYHESDCACAITCATQPMTLLAEQWRCALFLDQDGDLWYVTAMPGGNWDWPNAAELNTRYNLDDSSVRIERLLRQAAHELGNAIH
ncbi:hypothetical protein Daura_06295 [Dactylosporangium aurantiacum]|uniref:Uncharacterized protein n=1 Tax=Dactylosporangium aurantiacum TaxID=35754 RepID=A0A9Q9ME60_9ACTN|nr:hypothetical protein [Dactylosporangium aurantiacum]MDG6108783.1 hypothetical protein [Dactylosporangium aurantiacum]UWZ55808.1 hypothetical protein Daura_06295 [Dactylosporangium aurantiacum]